MPKQKAQKKFKPSAIPAATMMIVAGLALLILLVGGGYVWYYTSVIGPLQIIVDNQLKLQEQIDNIQTMPGSDASLSSMAEFLYSDAGNNFGYGKKSMDALTVFTPSNLSAQSDECGTDKNEAYFVRLLNEFGGKDKAVVYSFKYNKDSQEPNEWMVTVVPNRFGYKTMAEFENDFNFCAAGGDLYPTMVNDRYLLFVSGCGTGFNDGSGRPIGCDEVRKVIQPTIKLK
ncbi:MAG: hypothetical protein ACOZBH_04170 [Patescibacteria group bacterium]